MSLPEIPDPAWDAIDKHLHDRIADFQGALEGAWPLLYASVLNDFADRMEKALEIVGVGESPIDAYRFVVACARSLAEEATA